MFTDHAILKEQLKMSEQWVFCHGPVIISKEQVNPLARVVTRGGSRTAATFEASQKSVKIKIWVNFYFNAFFWNAQYGKG